MCKALADLLGIDDPLFSIGVHQLEQASGQPGVDVQLYSEIIRGSHQKVRELGLDPSDTTAQELYGALRELVKKHDEFLARRLGANNPSEVADILARVRGFLNHLHTPKSVWALKSSVAKRLLKQTPPKKVMKQLGYRSVDSMLKRESAAELFVALRFCESAAWTAAFVKKYKHLTPSDFETRDVEFLYMDGRKWGTVTESFVRAQHHNVTHMKEMGVVALLPLPMSHLPGITLAVMPLLLHYMNEVRTYSTYFKLQQVRPDFGETLVQTLLYDPYNHIQIAGHDVHWRTVHRHFGKPAAGSARHPEVFEPHVRAEDLFWRKAEDVLFHIEPALHFWHGMDFVAAKIEGNIISFNLMDIAVDHVNNLPFGKRSLHHLRAGLWNELFCRYIGQPALEYQVLQQLTPETSPSHVTDNILEELFI